MPPTADVAPAIDLEALPGFQVRRLHQIAVAIFLQEAADTGITPVQFGALQGIANQPGIDQRTLARSIGLDTSTLAGVIDRLGVTRARAAQRQPSRSPCAAAHAHPRGA
jgi:hypothetical protein